MATKTRTRYLDGLGDIKGGRISREIFVNEDIYQEEQEQVFTRSWLFVAHESQVSKPGGYFVSCMGEESVILYRDWAGQLHVFLNSCRHRGMKFCRYVDGNTPVFTCPDHGWSFANDGKLVGVPYFKDAYHEKLDKSKWGLVEVAQLETYKGSIWATWDGTAPSFPEYIGDFKMFLDFSLDFWDGREGGTEIIGGVQKWLIPCNWKFPAENFSGDSYHNISHRSVDMVGIGPSGQGRKDTKERAKARRLHGCFPERSHQTGACLLPKIGGDTANYQDSPVVARFFRETEERRGQARGEWARLMGSPGERYSPILPCIPGNRAPWRCGIPEGPIRPRSGAGTWWTAMPPRKRKTFWGSTTSATAGLPASPTRTTWGTGITPTPPGWEPSPAGIPTTMGRGWVSSNRILNTMGSGFPGS
jgi:phenylpropionate dioxygenase-like ring-hydroxylating dioxygenase large terminal subunit